MFDQTFVVTELLKLLILGIAFVGIGSAFMVLGLARRGRVADPAESLGLSPRHCRRLLVWRGRASAAHCAAGPAGGLWPRLVC